MNIVKKLRQCTNNEGSAIYFGSKRMDYQEFWSAVDAYTREIQCHIKQRMIVMLLYKNPLNFLIAMFSILKIGAIAVPIKMPVTKYELQKILDDNEASLLIYDDYNFVKELIENDRISSILEHQIGSILMLNNNFSMCQDYPDQSIASINYTLCGLGRSVGCITTHENYWEGAVGHIGLIKPLAGEKMLVIPPAQHTFAFTTGVICTMVWGGSIVIPDSYFPSKLFSMICDIKVDAILGVPAIYLMFAKFAHLYSSKFTPRYCISGGSYLPAADGKKIFDSLGWDIIQGYGLTECLPVACNIPEKNRLGTLGKPGPGVQIVAKDKFGQQLPVGCYGELCVKYGTIMLGYYKALEETRNTIDSEGWLHTGDVGMLDQDGYIIFKERLKRIAKVNGLSVDLKEIEQVVTKNTGILANATAKFDFTTLNDNIELVLNGELNGSDVERCKNIIFKLLSRYKWPKSIVIQKSELHTT